MPNYVLSKLDYPGSSNTSLTDLNLSGESVGSYDDGTQTSGFVDINGTFTQIQISGAQSTLVFSVNNSGNIVGAYSDSTAQFHGFTDIGGILSPLNYPASLYSYATGINDSNEVVGYYDDSNLNLHGFTYLNGNFSSIDYPGSTATGVNAVNGAGDIAGFYEDSASTFHGFVDVNGSFTTIDMPGAASTYVFGINDSGALVGLYKDTAGNNHGFIDLNGSFSEIAYPGATSNAAFGINDDGAIVGQYIDATGAHGFTAGTAAPTTVAQTVSFGEGTTVGGTAGVTGTGALAGDSDPNGLNLSILSVAGGTLGTALAGTYGELTLNADGSYSYAADNTAAIDAATAGGTPVSDSFTYTVGNGQGGSATETLTFGLLNPVYRFYDTVTNDHFYTTTAAEKASIQANLPTFTYEGAPWDTPTAGADTSDVFRFYDTVTKTHFLTQSVDEKNSIIQNLPTFNYEGVAFQAYTSVENSDEFALERFYNTNSKVHTYSATPQETAAITSGQVGQGWVDEGASFIVHKPV